MSDRTSTSWGFVRQAADLLASNNVRPGVGVSSWDENDETGASIADAIRGLLQRARDVAASAARGARRRAADAATALQSAAQTAAQWATDAAQHATLRGLARDAAEIGAAALGAVVPSWIWIVVALALVRGGRELAR